jgi:hypothetical protein
MVIAVPYNEELSEGGPSCLKWGGKEGGGGKGGEMTQTLCAHMNKRKKIIKIKSFV